MNRLFGSALVATTAAAAMLSATLAYADSSHGVRRYAVTVTNITRGQPIAPPAVVAHNDDFKLFVLGSPGIPELAPLAEDGNGAPLLSAVSSLPSVYRTALGSGGIPPGGSMTVEIETTARFPEISVAAMLGTTNDGFMAVRGVYAPRRGAVTVAAEGYDAGTEANSEDCAFIPGPPCGDFNHNPAAPEGYVHVHAGIHVGGGGLTPAMHDWRNPVAEIEIRRMD